MDTYRIAAVEQLRVFADLAGIPMEVAYKPEHMTVARRKFAAKDVIYIDTPGRSPRDSKSIAEIARYLKAIHPDEIHLVLNLSTRPGDLIEAARQFQVIPVNRIIFTKLDETDHYGAMLSVIPSLRLSVSYITFGQDIFIS
jgi:flagellar biosynthesis protein FlhF